MKHSEPDRLRIVACTVSLGQGNGIAMMDKALHETIDRGRFDLVYAYTSITRDQRPPEGAFHVFVPLKDRFRRLVELFHGADVVQFNGGTDVLACDAARAAGVPSIVEVMHQCERGQRLPEIDACVCVSEAVRRFQPRPDRAVVIPNGVDLRRFVPPASPRPNGRFVILQVAQRGKAMHFHADAIADRLLELDPRVELRLAGRGMTGPDSHGGRVGYLGLQYDMPRIYAEADVLLLASVRDGYGLACAEAMACGCVPVVSADGGMAAMVDHGHYGWLIDPPVPEKALELLQETIRLKDSGELEAFQKRGRKVAEERYSLESTVARYEGLYRDLVARNGRWGSRPKDGAPAWSAESLLVHTLWRLQAGAGLDEIVSDWLDLGEEPVRPLHEPADPVWVMAVGELFKAFRSIRDLGEPKLSAFLLNRLKGLGA